MIFGLVLLVGIALAGGAVYLAKDQIGHYKTAIARAEAAKAQIVPTKNIFVVNRALKYGEKLTKEDVREVPFPLVALPEGHFETLLAIFPVLFCVRSRKTKPCWKSKSQNLVKMRA
jgi:pilus assembly protein CpaB